MLHPIENASLRKATVKRLALESGSLPRQVVGLVHWIMDTKGLTAHNALKLAAAAIRIPAR